MGRDSRRLTAAALLAGIAIAAPFVLRRKPLVAELIEAAPRDSRSIEPRLAGFTAARLRAPSRGTEDAVDPANLQFRGVAGKVLAKTVERPTPDALHARGVALVLIGRAGESIAALHEAARQSEDARAWSDLAAARIVVAANERAEEWPQALADVGRAIELDPTLPEAHFNRALILEHLRLREPARRAWQRYLMIEPDGAWSREARERLKQLDIKRSTFDEKLPFDELTRRFPQELRETAEGLWFWQWASAEAKQEPAAGAMFERLRSAGEALQRTNGEQLLADAVAVIDRADAARRTAIAAAFQLYADGRGKLRDGHAGAAEPQFRRAAAMFAREESPLADIATYYAALTAFHQNRGDEAEEALQRLQKRLESRRHLALAAQIHSALAVQANAAGDWGTAARVADAGAEIFRTLGETNNAATLEGIGAVALEMIGDAHGAWTRRLRTFAALDHDPRYLGAFVGSSSVTLAAAGRERAAAAMLDVRIELAPPEDVAGLSVAHAAAVRLARRAGDARHALARARAYAAEVADPELRKTIHAHLDLADATSVAALDRSIDFFARTRNHLYLPDAHLQRARLQRAESNDAAAEKDLASGLQAVERQRATIREGIERLQFLDVAARLIEETIDFRLARGDVAGAFDLANRGRTLLDGTRIDTPPAAPAVQLAPHVALVAYAVLPREVVAFQVTHRGLSAARIAVDRDELAARIRAFGESIRRRDPLPRVQRDGEALHRMLIAPLQLPDATELVIVPDRELHALPFAALRNGKTKKYVMEEWTLRIAPSAFGSRSSAGAFEPALVVADPPAPPWPPLPASREEAANIAALHRATLLAGPAATRAAFLERARGSALIHFSGHANSDAGTSYGALLLAASERDDGIVGSNEIAGLRLERSPLVLLAACGTFRGSSGHVFGMSSLGRAFLAAGARGIIGTLWEIDDDVAATLFLDLHHHLRAGAPPAAALRDTQRSLLQSPDPHLAHPASWAPVELLAHV